MREEKMMPRFESDVLDYGVGFTIWFYCKFATCDVS